MAATTVGKTALQLQGDARPLEADMARAEKTVSGSADRMNRDLQKAGKGFELKSDTLSKMGLMFAGKAWLDQLTKGNETLSEMVTAVGKIGLGFAIGGPIGAGIAGLIVLAEKLVASWNDFIEKLTDTSGWDLAREFMDDADRMGIDRAREKFEREHMVSPGGSLFGQAAKGATDLIFNTMNTGETAVKDFGNAFKGVFIEQMEDGIARAKEMAAEQQKLADDAEATALEIRTPLQVFQDRMRDLQRQAAEGVLTQEEMDRAAGLAAERLRSGLPDSAGDPGSLMSVQGGSAEAIAAINRFRRGQEGPGQDKLNVVAELMRQDAARQQRNTRILEDILGQLEAQGEEGIFD